VAHFKSSLYLCSALCETWFHDITVLVFRVPWPQGVSSIIFIVVTVARFTTSYYGIFYPSNSLPIYTYCQRGCRRYSSRIGEALRHTNWENLETDFLAIVVGRSVSHNNYHHSVWHGEASWGRMEIQWYWEWTGTYSEPETPNMDCSVGQILLGDSRVDWNHRILWNTHSMLCSSWAHVLFSRFHRSMGLVWFPVHSGWAFHDPLTFRGSTCLSMLSYGFTLILYFASCNCCFSQIYFWCCSRWVDLVLLDTVPSSFAISPLYHGVNWQMNLEEVNEDDSKCTSRPWPSKLRDSLSRLNQASLENMLKWRSTALRDELAGRDEASLEMHWEGLYCVNLEVLIEQVWW